MINHSSVSYLFINTIPMIVSTKFFGTIRLLGAFFTGLNFFFANKNIGVIHHHHYCLQCRSVLIIRSRPAVFYETTIIFDRRKGEKVSERKRVRRKLQSKIDDTCVIQGK